MKILILLIEKGRDFLKLQNQTAIVTGGSSGIGEATVRRLADEGASVVITDINDELGKALEQELKDNHKNVKYMHIDVTSEDDVSRMIRETANQFGSVDIVFANAGIGDTKPIHELSYEE